MMAVSKKLDRRKKKKPVVADLCDKTLSKLFNSGTTNIVSSSRPLTERERQGIYVMCVDRMDWWWGGSMFLAPKQLQVCACSVVDRSDH